MVPVMEKKGYIDLSLSSPTNAHSCHDRSETEQHRRRDIFFAPPLQYFFFAVFFEFFIFFKFLFFFIY